jgi:hypothetical protein
MYFATYSCAGTRRKVRSARPVGVVCGDVVGLLEWIRAQVEDLGHAQGNEGFLPDSDIIRVTP